MDPLTSFFNALEAGFKLAQVVIEGQPPTVKAEIWKMYIEDVKATRAIFEKFSQFFMKEKQP